MWPAQQSRLLLHRARFGPRSRILSRSRSTCLGSQVVTDWQPGSPIVWKGEYEGKEYEDKGEIVEIEPEQRLKVTHFSPLTGQEDIPANYHTVLYELENHGRKTRVSLSQDNNSSEEAAEHSKANWEKMLAGLKEVVEAG